MYCPKCGQQQISDEMRFCSRCGIPLSGLAEWMAGGALPARPAAETQSDALSPRRKGIRRAAKLMFFSAVLIPVFLVISLVVDEGGPIIFPVVLFFVALVMMLYARLFSDKNPPLSTALNSPAALKSQAAQTSVLGSNPVRSALPQANIPIVSTNRQQVRTNELAQPPSVTENTTKLLDTE